MDENISHNRDVPAHKPHKPSAIRLHVSVIDGKVSQPKEVILARKRGYELVDAEGFVPADASPAVRLAALCEAICREELEAAQQRYGGSSDPKSADRLAAVQQFLSGIPAAVNQAVADGSLRIQGLAAGSQAGAPGSDEAAAEATGAGSSSALGLAVDLEARKAGLRARLERFRAEEAEWKQVLQQADDMVAATAPADLPAGSAAQPALEGGSGPAAGAAATGSMVLPASDGGSEPAAAAPAGDAPPGFAVAGGSGAVGLLRARQEEAYRAVALQVEGLCAMVGGVEDLVSKAERHCSLMQAEYHQEKFRTFPHIDSPARLIREMVRPPLPRRQRSDD
ncbi:hypothetical protein WJX72_011902 [[Myrmecia] bisecta]|uniref:Uncharacterized protein n=1 Tax=[Myrmecia] bisecta TaxID=41462 RepID=A0AAW1RB67_9CHLO